MLSNQDDFKNSSSIGDSKREQIEGLDSFKKNLEKHFFSEVSIRDLSVEAASVKLVLELNCNIVLDEMLDHFDRGTWGNFESKGFSFSSLIETLRESTDLYIEIEEFSIFLKDTAIVINKIYDDSIPEQLEAILSTVRDNHLHFTKGLTEVPYEIYVPVFEENLLEDDTTLMNIKSGNNLVQDYFKYWALYFYTEDEALIYDLKNTAIISGDVKMLNG